MIFIQDIVLTILLMLMVLGTLVYNGFKDMNL